MTVVESVKLRPKKSAERRFAHAVGVEVKRRRSKDKFNFPQITVAAGLRRSDHLGHSVRIRIRRTSNG
jgi:hypothetical protein